MSTVKANNHQIGQSGTATNNFTLYQPSTPDGTVRLAVGNSGATTGDVLSVSNTGLSVTGTLSATGNVSFDGGTFVFNESGADKDFRIEGDTEPNLFFTDASTDRVGIGTSSPGVKLDVKGSVRVNGFDSAYYNENILALGNATYNPKIGMASNTGYRWNTRINDVGGGDGEYVIRYEEGSVDAVTISRAGNLGLGAAPTAGKNNANSTRITIAGTNAATNGGEFIAAGAAATIAISSGTTASYVWTQENYPMVFGTNGSERARITSGGVLDLATGAGAVGQIQFPATQVASSNANTLDDYEEGTWTPNQGSGLTVVGTFSSAGYYTKVGNIVSVQGYVKGATSASCAAAGIICSNLPFSGVSGLLTPGSVIDWSATSNSSCAQQTTTTNLYNGTAITASDRLSFQVTYQVG